jgi:uncharacterized phage protein gp47/JayE
MSLDLPSRVDLLNVGRSYLLRFAKKIEPTQVDVAGSDANIFVGSQSVVADAVVKHLGYRINALLLDGATGDDLDRYALDRYTLSRKGASPAVGTVRLFRATTAAGSGTVPIGTKLLTLTNVEYETITAASFALSDTSVLADVRASQAGKATEVGANSIVKLSQPALLWDRTLQVNNDLTTAGGEDVEDDETFRNRIKQFWLTARRGVLAAIEFGALTVPGVVSAKAIEALTGGAQPARVVNLYIADSSGVASAALGKLVAAALDDFRAGGIAVLISTSIPLLVNISIALKFAAGVDTTQLSGLVQAAVVSFVNSLPVNGTLLVSDLQSVLARFKGDGVIVTSSSIVAPVGDLVPAIGQTLRTTLANVTISAA